MASVASVTLSYPAVVLRTLRETIVHLKSYVVNFSGGLLSPPQGENNFEKLQVQILGCI